MLSSDPNVVRTVGLFRYPGLGVLLGPGLSVLLGHGLGALPDPDLLPGLGKVPVPQLVDGDWEISERTDQPACGRKRGR